VRKQMLRGRTKERFGVHHFASALPCFVVGFRLQTGREPHEYQASCVGGRIAGWRWHKAVVLFRGRWREGCVSCRFLWDLVGNQLRGSVRTVIRSDMVLVWASKEGVSSLVSATTVRTGGKEVIWARVIGPGMVRTSHETYCVLHQDNINVL
jgi:hypothetical protein